MPRKVTSSTGAVQREEYNRHGSEYSSDVKHGMVEKIGEKNRHEQNSVDDMPAVLEDEEARVSCGSLV